MVRPGYPHSFAAPVRQGLACGLLVLASVVAGSAATLDVPGRFATIQAALDAASDGISVFGADASIVDNVITGNSAVHRGGVRFETLVTNGGIHPFTGGTASPVDFIDNVTSNNTYINAGCSELNDPACCRGTVAPTWPSCEGAVFTDGFESGNTDAWQ